MTATVGIAVVLAGCGSDGTENAARQTPQAEASPADSPIDEGSALEGTWATDLVSKRDAEKTLRQNGLAKWIGRFRPLSPIADDTVLVLEIGDQWDLYRQVKGGPREEVDYNADYSLEANKVEVVHSAGSNAFRWSVDGDVLTLVC
ncbi:MAG: hypothetical protein ABR505_08405 [Actinomycetota bacterium]